MKLIRREQFLWKFMRKSEVDVCFEKIIFNNKPLFVNPCKTNNLPHVIYISLFPNFLEPFICNNEYYMLKKINNVDFSGTGIALEKELTLESYLTKYLKKQTIINLRRTISHLEGSFNISYEYNHGEISEDKCKYLLNTLYNMLKRRFSQKKEANNHFAYWNEYTKNISTLINKKKASIFVIYENKKPN